MNCEGHRPWASVVAHNGRATTGPGEIELQLWDLDRLPRLRTNLLDLHNRTSNTVSIDCNWGITVSAARDQGKRHLRHDRVVDDFDMHNNGHVIQSRIAQLNTVRTCL